MRSIHRAIPWAIAALIWAIALPAAADYSNITAGGASPLPADGSVISSDYIYGGGTYANRWYVTRLKGGRSYSIQATPFGTYNAGACTSGFVRFVLYASDGTSAAPGTALNTHDADPAYQIGPLNTLCEAYQGSWRISYTPAAAAGADEFIFIKTQNYALGVSDYSFYNISVTETTLYGNWFYTDGNYESYVTIVNASSQNSDATVTWYNYNTSTALGSSTVSIPPFGSRYVAAKTTTGLTAGALGSVKITHNGPPKTIQASLTAINTTGIGAHHSFLIPFQTVSK